MHAHILRRNFVFFGLLFTSNYYAAGLCQLMQGATVNSSVTAPAASTGEPYGINMSTNSFGPSTQRYQPRNITITGETSTRHYRWGQSTGIGNSFIQTASPTSESRPLVTHYTDYSFLSNKTPASTSINANAPHGQSFSHAMTSPAFTTVTNQALGRNINESSPVLGPNFDKLPNLYKPFSDVHFGESFIKTSRTGLGSISL